MDTELVFSDSLMAAMTVLFAACVLVPTMYYVWNVYRKRFNHVAMLAGLACFFIFGFLLSENLLRLLAPAGAAGSMGMWGYGVTRSLCVAVCEVGGIALSLWMLQRQQHSTIRVPNGFALGFRLFEMLYLGAMNTLIPLILAMTVSRDGLESVLATVEEAQAPAMELQLRNLAETAPGVYWMSTVDYVCRFALPVALTRLIWYGFEGGRYPADKRLIAAAFGLDLLCELMLALHDGGGSYHLCAAIYYVLVAGAICLAYYEARKRDDPELIRADRLQGRNLRRRR
jgi:uncharacterized membrane protein YhfC